MNWNEGFSARYYYTVVDPSTWRDLSRHELTGGTVMRTDSNLLQSATINVTDLPTENEAWIRVWLDARQGKDGAHEALFTGLMSAPVVDWDGNRKSYQTECYSVLKPAADILLDRGWYAAAGVNAALLISNLLKAGPAPVICEDEAPHLLESIVAENNETNLTMVWKILNAIGWQLRILGSGNIRIEPKPAEPTITLDSVGNDIVELSVKDTRDWFSCPNVFRAESGDRIAVVRDDDENSPLSTVSRGREIWAEERDVKLADNEGIETYARRKLAELQSPARTISYTRRYLPTVSVGDLVTVHYPKQHIEADFRISSQSIEFGYGARTSEEAVMV